MSDKLSVIIPNKSDPNLLQTITRIEETMAGNVPEIIVVNDGSPTCTDLPKHVVQISNPVTMGTSYSRHVGIMNASNEHTINIDAHMDFRNGSNWAGCVADELAKADNNVLCCQMLSLKDSTTLDVDDDVPVYNAARIKLLHSVLNTGECYALSGVWDNTNKPYDEISCIMGACYAVNRDWYINGLNSPWNLGRGWGCDEETLSISNWLCGGKNVLIPVEIGHKFISTDRIGYTRDQVVAIWCNRIRISRMFPMSPELATKLNTWTTSCRAVLSYRNEAIDLLNSLNYESYTDFLASHGRTLNDFIDHFNIIDDVYGDV